MQTYENTNYGPMKGLCSTLIGCDARTGSIERGSLTTFFLQSVARAKGFCENFGSG